METKNKFNKIKVFTAFLLILAFLFTSIAQAKTITVCKSGCDYTSIQSAINSANIGDTIEVQSGTYYENVNVTKQIILRGIDTGAGMPVVDAGGSGDVITLSADGITLEGFEARNSGSSWPDSGIKVTSDNNVIKNNNASNNYYGYGISLLYSSNNKIYLNNFINNTDSFYSYNSTNLWNSTSKITYTYNGTRNTNYLGNYWNDYTGTDLNGDGIGDTAYSIDGDKDNYPLMEPYENYITPTPSEQPILKAPWNGTKTITQGNYGSTSHYDHGIWDNTYAIDVNLNYEEVLAPADGVVIYVDNDQSGAGGKELAINHTGPTEKNFTTVYLHLSEIYVKKG
ncbi:MAG: NosD domain-containing protein, partial [Methanosarcinales archaeon]